MIPSHLTQSARAKHMPISLIGKVIPCLFLTISLLTPSARAEEQVSPLSPAFTLAPAQILSTTSVYHKNVNFQAYQDIAGFGRANASAEVRGFLISQSFRFGLDQGLELGISESYSHAHSDNKTLLRVADGFYNPTVFGRKVWFLMPNVQLITHASVTPKTGDHELRDIATQYKLGASGVLTTDNGLVTTLGLSRNFSNNHDLPNATTVHVGAFKELAMFSLAVDAAISTYDQQSTFSNSLPFDAVLTTSIALGRQLSSNLWAQLEYQYTNTEYQTMRVGPSNMLGASSHTNQVGATIKCSF